MTSYSVPIKTSTSVTHIIFTLPFGYPALVMVKPWPLPDGMSLCQISALNVCVALHQRSCCVHLFFSETKVNIETPTRQGNVNPDQLSSTSVQRKSSLQLPSWPALLSIHREESMSTSYSSVSESIQCVLTLQVVKSSVFLYFQPWCSESFIPMTINSLWRWMSSHAQNQKYPCGRCQYVL